MLEIFDCVLPDFALQEWFKSWKDNLQTRNQKILKYYIIILIILFKYYIFLKYTVEADSETSGKFVSTNFIHWY